VKLNNFREPGETMPPSARTGGSQTIEGGDEELFDPSKIPVKIPIIKLKNEQGLQVCAYHCEAPYAIRKTLIEAAKKTFKDKDLGIEKADVVALLAHSATRTKMLDERFEDMFIKT